MGLKWCLRFSYKGPIPSSPFSTSTCDVHHVITLHQVINGNVSLASAASKKFLDKGFSIKTYLKHPMSIGSEEIGVNTVNAVTLWYGGSNKDDIYKEIPGLYDRCEVKVVCRFYGQPLSEFQVKIIEETQFSWKLDKSVQVSAEVMQDLESLSSDFSQLLEKGILPDVTVECGGRTFQAHRSVLAARSEVFQAMFQNKMLESETGAVKVSDMDVDVLEKLLKFIYSGKLGDLTEKNTADLYEAADKYDIVSLKKACSYWMIRNLTEENCISYLQIAGSHSDPDLKDAVISFIVENSKVLSSEAWFTFLKEPSDLANEVFKAYIASGY